MVKYYQLRNQFLNRVSLPRKYRHLMSKESVWGWLFLVPTLVSLGLVSVYPVFRAAYLSMNEYNGITPPTWVGPAHYVKILSGWPEFWQVLLNTVSWAFGSIIIMLVVGMGFAVLLNREFRGRNVVQGLLLLPWAMPYIAVALNFQWMYNYNLGVFNGLLRLVGLGAIPWIGSSKYALFSAMLGWVWRNFPFFMISFLAAMKAIPDSLYEAALVDGSTRWELFRHITLPYLQPVIIVTTLLMSLWTFNNFTMIFVLTSGGPGMSSMVLPVYVYNNAFLSNSVGLASAIGMVMMVIMLGYGLVYLQLYRQDIGQV